MWVEQEHFKIYLKTFILLMFFNRSFFSIFWVEKFTTELTQLLWCRAYIVPLIIAFFFKFPKNNLFRESTFIKSNIITTFCRTFFQTQQLKKISQSLNIGPLKRIWSPYSFTHNNFSHITRLIKHIHTDNRNHHRPCCQGDQICLKACTAIT